MMSRIPIADRLSISRITLTFALVAAFFLGWEAYAVTFFALGWGTDLLDGYFARLYGSWRDKHPGLDMDGICDSVLAFGASGVVVIYGWFHYPAPLVWALVGLYALTIISGAAMALVMNQPRQQPWMKRLIAINMIVIHGGLQIFGTGVWLSYMAFGQTGIALALVVAAPVIWYQAPKMQLWLQGRFA